MTPTTMTEINEMKLLMKPTKFTKPLRASVLCVLLTTACDDVDRGNDASENGSTTDRGPTYEELFECDTGAFTISKPLIGPGFDPARGGVLGELQPTYVVHTTQLFLDLERIAEFQAIADPISVQLDETEGLLAYSYAGDEGCGEASTLAIWASEDAMYRFVATGAHAQAMGRANDVGRTGRVTHWTVTGAEVNAVDWELARAKVREVEPSGAFER